MKKFAALILAVMMLFTCAACADDTGYNEENPASIMAFYSIKSVEGDFIVEVQDLGGVYSELYDKDGIYIKFTGDEAIFDKDGNAIKREDLNYGDTLEIQFNGKLSGKNPKTIKAYKIIKIL